MATGRFFGSNVGPMAARLIGALRWIGLSLAGLSLVFLLAAWIGAAIPRNSDWTEPDNGVTILVGSNGIHTELIMPVTSSIVDWRAHFPLNELGDPSRDYTHVGVSWGERSFFLETPTWAEFNLFTALGALTGGEGLLHAAYYVRPAPAEDFRELRIREEEYRKLADLILKDLSRSDSQPPHPGYSSHDAFYVARGTYHIANTCNQWTSDRLSAAGIKTGLWTPFPGGVMQWVPKPETG